MGENGTPILTQRPQLASYIVMCCFKRCTTAEYLQNPKSLPWERSALSWRHVRRSASARRKRRRRWRKRREEAGQKGTAGRGRRRRGAGWEPGRIPYEGEEVSFFSLNTGNNRSDQIRLDQSIFMAKIQQFLTFQCILSTYNHFFFKALTHQSGLVSFLCRKEASFAAAGNKMTKHHDMNYIFAALALLCSFIADWTSVASCSVQLYLNIVQEYTNQTK